MLELLQLHAFPACCRADLKQFHDAMLDATLAEGLIGFQTVRRPLTLTRRTSTAACGIQHVECILAQMRQDICRRTTAARQQASCIIEMRRDAAPPETATTQDEERFMETGR
jgi:hypothetical protein